MINDHDSSSRREFVQTLGAMAAVPLASPGLLGAPFGVPSASPDVRAVLYRPAQAFVDMLAAQGGKPLYEMSPADAREVLEKLQSGPVDKPPADIQEKVFPVGPSGKVSVRIYRPQGVTTALPTVVYIHGGGWILGSANTHDRLLRDLTSASRLAYVFVNYTRSPEARYPTAIEESYAVAKYVVEHGAEHNLDGRRLAIAGDSVGGNMTSAVTMLAKERNGPAITYWAMLYPVTDASFSQPSYSQFSNGPWLSKRAMEWFWDAYQPNKQERMKITASPLRATTDQLKGMPRGLLLTDMNDVLRDEGEAYGQNLIAAGVDIAVQRYFGIFHDFMMLNALADTPGTKFAIETTAKSLAAALG
ncbi:MAG TPA: alpha/beta hydrolase fold domain-containing protein [Gemmatimonadaceae bacterium]